MGAKQSTGSNTPSRVRTYSSSGTHNGAGPHVSVGGSHGAGSRARARSLGSFNSQSPGLHMIPVGNGSGPGAVGGSPDSDSSSDEPVSYSVAHSHGLRNITSSLPVHLIALHGRYICLFYNTLVTVNTYIIIAKYLGQMLRNRSSKEYQTCANIHVQQAFKLICLCSATHHEKIKQHHFKLEVSLQYHIHNFFYTSLSVKFKLLFKMP